MPVQSTRILVVEDEPAHAEAISRSLEGSEGTAIMVLTSLQAFHEQGLAWNPDIALIDLNLPDGRAMEVLTSASNPLTFPVIIMTSYGNERTAVEAMKSGALDYLVKAPETFFGLSRSIERWLREWELLRKNKAVQRELLAREETYRRQFTHNASIMIMIDPSDGRIIDANLSAAKFYGYTLPQLLGMRISDINILPESEIKRAMISALVHHGKTFEFQHRLADGSIRDVEVSSSSILIGGRQILHSIIHDISGRKRAEESLRKISIAVEQSPSAIVITDAEGAIEYVNPRFSMMTGYTLDEVRGQNPRILNSGEFPPEVYKNLWDTILVGEIWRGYFHNRKKNGDLYWEHASISPIRDDQGCITSFVAIKEDVTERMHMEARLRESEAKNSALIRAIPDLIFTNRVDGEFLDVHAPDSSLLIATPETFLHRKPHDVLPKYLADLFSKSYVDTLESGTVHELNYSVFLGEQERFFEARMAPCTEDTLITIVREVTERNQAEARLRLSEERYKKLFEEAPLGIALADSLTGHVYAMNPMFAKIAGRTIEEMAHIDWMRITHPDDVQKDLDHMARMNAGEIPGFRLEKRYLHPDGRVAWVNMTITKLKHEDKETPCHLCMIEDITERKQVELALSESEIRFRELFATSKDGIAMEDKEARYVDCNRAYLDLIGCSSVEELRGRSSEDYTPPKYWQYERQLVRVTLLENSSLTYEKEYVQPSGERVPVEIRAWARCNSQGEPLGYWVIARDISEQKKAQEQIRRMNKELEQRVKDRTAQLEAANKEMEAFSYSVSHDLRSPLRSIDGFSRALAEDYQGLLDEEGKRYVSRIRAGTQRMGQLIDDLLKLSQVSRSRLNGVETDLSLLCKKVMDELIQGAPARRIEVSIQPGLFAWADRNLLLVVLENLLRNAWKFTSKREDAKIEVGETTSPTGERAFFIRDNGAGFDMAHADKLFNAFQRLHAATDFDGTGIGLTIVQRIIHRHGGQIWAESEPGQGATFHFTLPDRCKL